MSVQLKSPKLNELNRMTLHANHNDEQFNEIIGCIEDMFLNDEFLEKQHNFMEKYWTKFEDSEENKLEYMDIFKEYQNDIEAFIEMYLQKSVANFNMNCFIQELQKRRDQLNGEIFEVLFTLTDFLFFKEMLLDYKAMKEGKTIDLTDDVFITKLDLITK